MLASPAAKSMTSTEPAIDLREASFTELSNYFTNLAQTEGAIHAFTILRDAQFGGNIDTHLLAHVVGDELYKQHGIEAMRYCTREFRNACSHSVVIGALLNEGMSALDMVHDACQKAPGGSGAYTMCFHGFGHGVLAYTNYEVPDAIELCRKVGTEEYSDQEFKQCVGGVVMEMHSGVHDVDVWREKAKKYLSPDDPLKLCTASYMPEEAKYYCYSYITPYIFDAVGVEWGSSTVRGLEESFAYCSTTEESYRITCYEGIGKELIVIVQGHDVRALDKTTDEQLQQVIQWCHHAPLGEATSACLYEIIDSLFWGGENDPMASVRFCELVPGDYQNGCYERLYGNMKTYFTSKRQGEVCRLMNKNRRGECWEYFIDNGDES